MTEEIRKEIFKELIKNTFKDDYNKKIIITIAGPIGSGKSTISKRLAKDLNLCVADNDEIRRLIKEKEIELPSDSNIIYELAYERIKYLLDNNISFILDCDITRMWDKYKDLCNKYNYDIFLIYIECKENIIIKRRTDRDCVGVKNLSSSLKIIKEDNEIYKNIRNNTNFENMISVKVNTSNNFEDYIEKIESKFNEYINDLKKSENKGGK